MCLGSIIECGWIQHPAKMRLYLRNQVPTVYRICHAPFRTPGDLYQTINTTYTCNSTCRPPAG